MKFSKNLTVLYKKIEQQ